MIHHLIWDTVQQAAAEANRFNKTVIFEALSRAGITHVRVAFDGEGDQGQMDRAIAETKGRTVECPDVKVTICLAYCDAVDLTPKEMGLQSAIEHICYGYLEEKFGGWVIGEGSFGRFVFDVENGSLTLDYSGRIVETDYSHHTL